MKKNILNIFLAVLLFLIGVLFALVINLYKKPKTIVNIPQPLPAVVVEEPKTETKIEEKKEPEYPEFSKYGIKPREARYYE